jgi:hypothetical protein
MVAIGASDLNDMASRLCGLTLRVAINRKRGVLFDVPLLQGTALRKIAEQEQIRGCQRGTIVACGASEIGRRDEATRQGRLRCDDPSERIAKDADPVRINAIVPIVLPRIEIELL